ncbi:MAG: phage head-tail connector protein [Actinobacteria bacterium]|nr:phage head-tail connector protein [Actinomycetota bacterium]
MTTPAGGLYITADELKARLAITGTSDDDQVQQAVQGASRAIDGYCERYFWQAADTRTYIPRDLYLTRTDDLVSVTTLATDPGGTAATGGTFPVTWPAGSFQLLPVNPGRTGEQRPYTAIRAVGGLTFPWVTPVLLARMDRVQVTGVFGWPAVPQAVSTAAQILAADLFKLKDAPFGVAGFGEFGVVRIDANPQVSALLGPYVRHPVQAA